MLKVRFLSQEEIVGAAHYLQVLQEIYHALRDKSSGMKQVILHHDIAWSHKERIQEKGWELQSALQSEPSPWRLPSISVHKGSDARPALDEQ
jgi:hypothetical protein